MKFSSIKFITLSGENPAELELEFDNNGEVLKLVGLVESLKDVVAVIKERDSKISGEVEHKNGIIKSLDLRISGRVEYSIIGREPQQTPRQDQEVVQTQELPIAKQEAAQEKE